ncbi:MAG: ACT domain-containing protein [Candidatus Omnitrophota bacterium]
MINSVSIGEEIVITAKNKVGLLADIAVILANHGINIESVLGYESGRSAKLLLVTQANLPIMTILKKKKYRLIKETEVIIVDLKNHPGALKVVTTELKNNKIDIKYIYVTSCSCGGSSRMILQTSNNERVMSLLTRYIE